MTTNTERVPPSADIARIVDQITESMLGMGTHPADRGAMANDLWTACVAIEGTYAVTVTAQRGFAAWLASVFFEEPLEGIGDDSAADAMGEFSNVIAGNVKSLVSYHTGRTLSLSLPMVSSEAPRLVGAVARRQVNLACGEHALCVELWEVPTPGNVKG